MIDEIIASIYAEPHNWRLGKNWIEHEKGVMLTTPNWLAGTTYEIAEPTKVSLGFWERRKVRKAVNWLIRWNIVNRLSVELEVE